jgi:hypothetical protein
MSPTQKKAFKEIYQGLMTSDVTTRNVDNDLVSAFFPTTILLDRKTIISRTLLQSTGASIHLQPQLPTPIQFGNTNEHFQNIWLDIPNVVTGTIQRTSDEVAVTFTTTEPSFISVQVKLIPSGVIRRDIIKHAYAIKRDHKLILSGDFICLNIDSIAIN